MSFSSDIKKEIENRKEAKNHCALAFEKGKNGDLDKAAVERECCKRAYIKGSFLSCGSISDPEKSYHFEMLCETEERANFIVELLIPFGIEAKVVKRKKYFVAYLKESEMISDTLKLMGANMGALSFENAVVLHSVSERVNRRNNCDLANLNKTIDAGFKQREDIKYIFEEKGIEFLKPELREIAYLRMDNPDASLKELGEMLNPPIGKSGVNHRMRKISELADLLREGDEGKKS